MENLERMWWRNVDGGGASISLSRGDLERFWEKGGETAKIGVAQNHSIYQVALHDGWMFFGQVEGSAAVACFPGAAELLGPPLDW